MALRVVELATAIEDVTSIYQMIAAEQPGAAHRFLVACFALRDSLAEMPGQGAPHDEVKRIRKMPIKGFNNFIVYYAHLDHVVEVRRVVHGAQDRSRLI